MSVLLPAWSDLSDQASRLADLVWSKDCARVGETAVVSTHIHTFDPSNPNAIGVVTTSDAGRVFYHRANAGEIVHIDVFHEVGEVDHNVVGSWLRKAVEMAGYHELSDLIDLQTGTGGGRLTGSLKFGTKTSLRRAHMNHVHVTTAIGPQQAGLILWLVAGAECAILETRREIRKVSHLICQHGDNSQTSDLSPYSTPSDSNLRGNQAEREIQEQQMMQSATDLSDEFGGVDQIEELLNEVARTEGQTGPMSLFRDRPVGFQDQVEKLIGKGLAKREGRKISLTDQGWALKDFLSMKSREIEMQFRRLLRKCPRIKPPREKQSHSPSKATRSGRAFGVRSMPIPPGDWPGSLAVSETLISALSRSPEEFSIEISDLRTYPLKPRRTSDVCLLIDASASMAGKRIKAAKYLAQHLLLTSKDRVSVIVFQEGSVKVEVPFTRNFSQAQSGLARVQPMGLTPLAEGITSALAYIRECKVRQPLLLLITDGIPTVPKWTLNPLEDSLQAAAQLPPARVRFGCIGLQPNKTFLQTLSRKAKGTLYIVDELEKETLANIAHKERLR